MKILIISIASAVLGFYFIVAIPFLVAYIGVAEYKAHVWYCDSTGGFMTHTTDGRVYGKGEICDYK